MATKNDVTGDSIQTKITSDAYRAGHDLIFKKKQQLMEDEAEAKSSLVEEDESSTESS